MLDRLPGTQRHGPAAAALLGALVLLSGCGGGSDDTGSSDEPGTTVSEAAPTAATQAEGSTTEPAPARDDEDLIRESITGVFASGDPATACETYATPKYVTNAFGDLDGCKAAVSSGGAAKGLDIAAVAVSDGKATADVTPAGGAAGGQTIHLELVKDGPDWKVDSATSNVPVGP